MSEQQTTSTNPRIAVIGEAFIDKYWLAEATRLSPEAPIPVAKVYDTLVLAGGAGNVREQLRALGVQPIYIPQAEGQPIKNRLMISNVQLARWDEYDSIKPLRDEAYASLAQKLATCDGIIVSDYGKGFFTPEAITKLAEAAPSQVVWFIDSKRSPFDWTPLGANCFFFPNLKEYRQHREAYQEEWERTILKRGAEGMSFREIKVPSYITTPISVCGAGDTVIAAFAYQYLTSSANGATASMYDCLDFASRAAAVVCNKPYTATASLVETRAVRPSVESSTGSLG